MAWNSCRDCFNNKNNKNSFHLEKEDLVLLFERERETVDDRAEDLQELGHPVVPLRLVDEVVEDVVDLLSTIKEERVVKFYWK